MSTASQHKEAVDRPHGSFPVLSGRVDPKMVEWALARLHISKAELVKLAVVDFITRMMKEAA